MIIHKISHQLTKPTTQQKNGPKNNFIIFEQIYILYSFCFHILGQTGQLRYKFSHFNNNFARINDTQHLYKQCNFRLKNELFYPQQQQQRKM